MNTSKVLPMSFASNSNDMDDVVNSSETGEQKFNKSMERLIAQTFPILNPSAPMKQRITILENTAEVQNQTNALTLQTFSNVKEDLNNVHEGFHQTLLDLQASYDTKLQNLKKEYDHRFELQTTENKRLQNNVAQLKADTNQLKRKLNKSIEQLKNLQAEFGLEAEDIFDDDTTSISANLSISRPNTSAIN